MFYFFTQRTYFSSFFVFFFTSTQNLTPATSYLYFLSPFSFLFNYQIKYNTNTLQTPEKPYTKEGDLEKSFNKHLKPSKSYNSTLYISTKTNIQNPVLRILPHIVYCIYFTFSHAHVLIYLYFSNHPLSRLL